MRKLYNFLAIGSAALILCACTASRPPSYNLPASDSLASGGSYTVGRNENIYAVAQKSGVKMRDLIAINGLKPPFALRSGQTLVLPTKDGSGSFAPIPQAAPLEPIDKGYMAPASNGSGGSAGIQTVKEETLPPLSGASVSSTPLSSTNSTVTPPKPLTNWKNTPRPVESPEMPEDIKPLPAATDASQEPLPVEQNTTQAVAPSSPTTNQSAAAATAAQPTFGWPVRGTIISAFGPKGQSLDNDGINISAPKGSPVKAAEGGMVAYAGNEMKGFGNLVLIKHEGGWVTAYAHLERLVVAKDNIVAKGDMIGTVGTSGGVSSPQLHFETRQDGRPVDPELVIK